MEQKTNEALSTSNLVIILYSLFIGPFIFYAPIALGSNSTLSTIFLATLAIIALTSVAISAYRITRLYPVDPFFSSVKEWAGTEWGRFTATCANLALSIMILSFTWDAAQKIITLWLSITQAKDIGYFPTNTFLACIIMLSLLLLFTSDNKKITRFSQYVFLSITLISVLLTAIVCFKHYNVTHLLRHKIAENTNRFWLGSLGTPLFISRVAGTALFVFSAAGLLLAQQRCRKTLKKAASTSAFLIATTYLIFTLSMLYVPQALFSPEGSLEEILLRHQALSWLVPIVTIGKITGILGLIQALIYASQRIQPFVVRTIKNLWSHASKLPVAILYVFGAAATFSFIHPWVATLPSFLLFSTTIAASCVTLFAKKQNTTFFESLTAAVGLISSSLICGISTYILFLIVYIALWTFVLWPSM